MKTWRALRSGPITRISLGLTALLITLLLLADLLLGVVPGHGVTERQVRKKMAENLTIQVTSLLQAGDHVTVGKTIQQILARNPDVRSIAVRRHDGAMVLQRGDDPRHARTAGDYRSDLDHVRVPILAGQQVWGEVELYFVPLEVAGVRQWLAQPGVQLLGVLGLGGFLLSYAYLSRAMQYLNPSNSIPDRVRKAFDNLTEGLVIIDQQARIVLANAAFRRLHPGAAAPLNGQRIDSLPWLVAGRGGPVADAPWLRTLATAVTVTDEPLTLPRPDDEALQLRVTSAPVTDPKGQVRGCMVSFNDVTGVHRSNEELRGALAALERSREEIEAKNEELKRLASRDPMTGCFNRRAFFEAAEEAFEAARRQHTPLCCVMSDIDHFKSFNDTYGHAVGDQVIQVVARALNGGIRQGDILCRYGGEEFCVLLPGASPQEALAVAERLRVEIADNAQGGVRGTEVRQITSSFGMASLLTGAKTLQELIDHADQALYRSKESGRNRVTAYERDTA